MSEAEGEALPGMEGVDRNPEQAMLFLFITLLIGALSRWFLDYLRHHFSIRIPYSVILLIIGGLLGWAQFSIRESGAAPGMFIESEMRWTQIAASPSFLLFMFLPALIYESSMTTDFFVFQNHARSSILLAGPGMLLQVGLIAVVSRYVLPYGWNWTECVWFGGILSATDPVAVIALLKEMGVMPDLRVLVEGESILNDATSIVVFEICSSVLFEPGRIDQYVGQGFRLTLGGPLLGIVFFLGCFEWLKRIKGPQEQTIVTVCSAYLCYFVAEGTSVKVSGVLAVFTQGVLMAGFGRSVITEEAQHVLHAFWGMLTFLSDTIIFVLAGAIITDQAFLSKHGRAFMAADWGYLFVLFILLFFIRAFVIFICSFYMRRYGHGLDAYTCSLEDFCKKMLVVTWGGLRGAVGLVLALSVNANPRVRLVTADPLFADRCLVFAAGIVVLTLILNATTLEWLIKALGLTKITQAEAQVYQGAIKYLDDVHMQQLGSLQQRTLYPDLTRARWDLVERLTKKPSESEDPIARARKEEYNKFSRRGSVTQLLRRRISGSEEGEDWDQTRHEDVKDEPSAVHLAGAYHSRFLMSLKASYSHQHNKGLVSSRPFRTVMWAVDQAMVYNTRNDREMESPLGFEWAWLQQSLLMRSAETARALHARGGLLTLPLRPFLSSVVRSLAKEELQMFKALLKAHSEAQSFEDLGISTHKSVLDMSQEIVAQVEAKLAEIERDRPDVATEVCTEMAAHTIIGKVLRKARKLESLGQLTTVEREAVEARLQEQREHVIKHPPFYIPSGSADDVHNIPFFKVAGDEFLTVIWDRLRSDVQTFKQNEALFAEGEYNDGIWFVRKGSVRLQRGDGDHGHSVVFSGGTMGEIETMARDAGGIRCRNTHSAVAATEVLAMHINVHKMVWAMATYTCIRQRMWQLYGRSLIEKRPDLFGGPVSIALVEDAKFGSAVIRRPLQFVSVRNRCLGLLLRGEVQYQDGAVIKSFALIDPNNDSDSLTFLSKDTIVLLFNYANQEHAHGHFAGAAVKHLRKNSLVRRMQSAGIRMPQVKAQGHKALQSTRRKSWNDPGVERTSSIVRGERMDDNNRHPMQSASLEGLQPLLGAVSTRLEDLKHLVNTRGRRPSSSCSNENSECLTGGPTPNGSLHGSFTLSSPKPTATRSPNASKWAHSGARSPPPRTSLDDGNYSPGFAPMSRGLHSPAPSHGSAQGGNFSPGPAHAHGHVRAETDIVLRMWPPSAETHVEDTIPEEASSDAAGWASCNGASPQRASDEPAAQPPGVLSPLRLLKGEGGGAGDAQDLGVKARRLEESLFGNGNGNGFGNGNAVGHEGGDVELSGTPVTADIGTCAEDTDAPSFVPMPEGLPEGPPLRNLLDTPRKNSLPLRTGAGVRDWQIELQTLEDFARRLDDINEQLPGGARDESMC